jgi:hypothetical protein
MVTITFITAQHHEEKSRQTTVRKMKTSWLLSLDERLYQPQGVQGGLTCPFLV